MVNMRNKAATSANQNHAYGTHGSLAYLKVLKVSSYHYFIMTNATLKKAVVGIDLGTTFSCIAVEKGNQIQTVANKYGVRPTASAVFFDSPRLIGQMALDRAQDHPGRTVHSVKRLIGRPFDELAVQNLTKLVEYTIVNVGGEPSIRVDVDGSVETYRPEEISAMILGEVKQDAETLLDGNVTKAVITVPAAFNESQRLATKHAGMIAGLDVRAVINEPTAAALAWAYSNPKEAFCDKPKLVLVFDMGGGTTDVSIVSVSSKEVRVTSTNGDPQLGGNDIDNALVSVFVEEIKNKHERDISQDRKAMIRLRKHCNELKHQLSKVEKVAMTLENVMPGVPFKIDMSRARFEIIIGDIIGKALKVVREALKMDVDACDHSMPVEIDNIVLVGGSSKMPWVERIFKDSLAGGKPVERTVNCDEAIAFGAGVYAAKLAGVKDILPDIRLLDVAPLSYGIEVKGGEMPQIIQRNTPVPASHTRTYTTNTDMQKSVRTQVYQGDSKMCSEKKMLQQLDVPVEPALKGVPDIQVTFSFSHDFMLTVTAKDLASKGQTKIIEVNSLSVQIQEAINAMREKESRRWEAENAETERMALLDKLERLAYKRKAMDVVAWIKENRNASFNSLTYKFEKLLKKN